MAVDWHFQKMEGFSRALPKAPKSVELGLSGFQTRRSNDELDSILRECSRARSAFSIA